MSEDELEKAKQETSHWVKEAINNQTQLEIALNALIQICATSNITGKEAFEISRKAIDEIRKRR